MITAVMSFTRTMMAGQGELHLMDFSQVIFPKHMILQMQDTYKQARESVEIFTPIGILISSVLICSLKIIILLTFLELASIH